MQTLAVINQKGGVGKTTTVANLGAALARKDQDVCLVDLDSQSHLSLHFNLDPDEQSATVYEVLLGEGRISQAAEMINPHLCVIPSTTDLAGAELQLDKKENRYFGLRDGLKAAQGLPHDYVLIDCPPSLGLLTLNALAAADAVIIPIQPNFLAMQGLGKLLETVQLVRDEGINPKLRVAGVIFCMYEHITRLARDVESEIHGFLTQARGTNLPWADAVVFKSTIRRNIRLAECPSFGQPIFDYDPSCHGATDYSALADEFLSLLAPSREAAPQQTPTPHESTSPADANAPI